jgi:hypothetical protein
MCSKNTGREPSQASIVATVLFAALRLEADGVASLQQHVDGHTACRGHGQSKRKSAVSQPRGVVCCTLQVLRESLMRAGPTTLGAALDAGERSGPRWTGDAWLARRRRYSTARRDRAMT